MEEISLMSDSGTPFVLALPENMDIVQVYSKIAADVITEVDELERNKVVSEVKYDAKTGFVVLKQN